MTNQHRAYALLHGAEIESYRVHISNATSELVQGELRRTSRPPLLFTIKAQERQFDVAAFRSDIWREFAEYIRQEGLAPPASEPVHLKPSY